MHQPVWLFPGEMKSQWETEGPERSGIPYTVFAGHLHILAGERRNGAKYFILGPTGGNLKLAANPRLGLMQHITRVVVDGDSVRAEFLAAGRRMPESTAFDAYAMGLKTLLLMRGTQRE